MQASAQDEPIDWLLEQMDQQKIRLVMDPAIIKRIWVTMKHNGQLMQAYQPQPYDGIITLFCAKKSALEDGTQRGAIPFLRLVRAK